MRPDEMMLDQEPDSLSIKSAGERKKHTYDGIRRIRYPPISRQLRTARWDIFYPWGHSFINYDIAHSCALD